MAEEKKADRLLEEIYGQQTTSIEKFVKVLNAWKMAALFLGIAFLMTAGALVYFLTHPFEVSVRGLPVRGVGAFGENVVTEKQLEEFARAATYYLCNLNSSNLKANFDALETISTPDWSRQIESIYRDTQSQFDQLQMTQTCTVPAGSVKVKVLSKNRFLISVPADMVYWIRGKETRGKRIYRFVVRTCPATGENPYGFCIERWDIVNVQ